ncbi:MAG: macro domain-containing protein [Pseudobdellovibrionaceae bacterium]
MSQSVAEHAASANPERKNVQIRITHGHYTDVRDCGAMVFFMPENLEWKGPVNTDILAHVGPKLDDYVLEHVIKPKAGNAYAIAPDIWDGPRLIVAILPVWDWGMNDEERALKRCYRQILDVAEQEGIESLSLPAFGAGRREYPTRKAARWLMSVLREREYSRLREVQIVCKTVEIFVDYREAVVSALG